MNEKSLKARFESQINCWQWCKCCLCKWCLLLLVVVEIVKCIRYAHEMEFIIRIRKEIILRRSTSWTMTIMTTVEVTKYTQQNICCLTKSLTHTVDTRFLYFRCFIFFFNVEKRQHNKILFLTIQTSHSRYIQRRARLKPMENPSKHRKAVQFQIILLFFLFGFEWENKERQTPYRRKQKRKTITIKMRFNLTRISQK